jgi:cardiolipin synthase A/B
MKIVKSVRIDNISRSLFMLRTLRSQKTTLIPLFILALTVFAFVLYSAPSPAWAAQSSAHSLARKTPTPTPGITPTATTHSLQLFTEPEAGEQVILSAINNAHKSIWLEMYILTDKNIISALENAASKVSVRVMLEPHPDGSSSPQPTLDALKAAGASVEDTSPSFTLTHEKGMVIDGTTAFIMTSNFSYSALNGKNREYDIVDTNTQDVQMVSAIFNADWNRQSIQPSSLVVSPTNSRTTLTSFISSAKTSLIIEAEEMQDTAIEQAITNAEQRGVNVQVILPSPSSSTDPNAAGIATLTAAGVKVEEDAKLYMHAKMMVADGSHAFVGSENFSSTSLDSNRELGITFSDASIITTLQQDFQHDWGASQPAALQ